jgi:phospholipid/cholesterol/gamma-HCH transport system ATP-binding protein
MHELPPTLATSEQVGVPVIEVSHVSTRFGTAVVHRDVSLTVVRGEVFAIAGGNGCGKSTLLREIIGLLAPTTGTIRLLGTDSRQIDTVERKPATAAVRCDVPAWRPVQFHDSGGKRGGAAS